MDIVQLAMALSLVLITATIIVCGVWLVMILHELRSTLAKTNLILDDTKIVSASLAQPFSSFSEFIAGFKNGIALFNSLFDSKKKSLKS